MSDLIKCNAFETYKSSSLANLKTFDVTKLKSVAYRSSTNGFQPKYLVSPYFVKQQAVIGGRLSNDWMVEIIASNLAKKLDIPCVTQYGCNIIDGSKKFKGVYSLNFEEEQGYQFISFRTLLRTNGFDIEDFNFTSLATVNKLECMTNCLVRFANIDENKAREYFLNMAAIDILVGNVDRHDKNFGVFFRDDKFSTAYLFDNGMGLFEHTPYLETYDTWENAMREVYVAPYGEDPFEMIEILDKEYGFKKRFDNVDLSIEDSLFPNDFAIEYYKNILERLR